MNQRTSIPEPNFFSWLFDAPFPAVYFSGGDFIIEMVNDKCLKLLKKDRAIVGRRLLEVLPGMEDQPALEKLKRAYQDAAATEEKEEILWIRSNGIETKLYVNCYYKPILDERQNVLGVLLTGYDITDQVLARQKLQESAKQLEESEARFRTLISETPEVGAGLYLGRELRIQYVNDVMLRFWGKDKSIIGKTMRDALPELIGQPFLDQLDKVFTTGIPFTGKGVKALLKVDGELKASFYNYTYKPLRNSQGEIYAIHHMAVDVSDEIRTRNKLEKSQALLVQLADQMPQLVWMAEGDGSVKYYNKRVSEFAGFRVTSDGKYLWEGVVHPGDVDATTEAWNTAVNHLKTYEIEHRIQMKDGSYRWHLSRAYPHHTDEGIKWYGTATDVHETKLMEMNLEGLVKERTLELQRSNDDLQQFAHVASHDLKEPVRKIRTFSHKLHDEFRHILGERGNTFINKILNATDRMYSMIDGVLNYASLSSVASSPEMVNLNSVIKDIETDLELLIEEKQAVITCEDLPVVRGIPELIHQLFYNLINNSLKFAKAKTPARIKISVGVGMVKDVAFDEIIVSDNGIGFDAQYAGQIFSTFVRLNSKDKYEGSGLGLSLCKKIVERHGGLIAAKSTPGEGAEFRILLPK